MSNKDIWITAINIIKDKSNILWQSDMHLRDSGYLIKPPKFIVQVNPANADDLLADLTKLGIKTKIISTNSAIKLSVSSIARTKLVTKQDIAEQTMIDIDKYFKDKSDIDINQLKATARKNINKLFDEQSLYKATTKKTGQCYKINYYDTTQGKRMQTALGDVVVVVSTSDITVVEAEPRKTRSDSILTGVSEKIIATQLDIIDDIMLDFCIYWVDK